MHPNERQLDQYRKQRLTPEEAGRVGAHVQACGLCAGRLKDLERLDAYLDSAMPDALSADFTRRLMERLEFPQERTAVPDSPRSRRRLVLRPELVNVLVAASATYLFVASGAFRMLSVLDKTSLEAQVFGRLGIALKLVGQWMNGIY